MKKMKRFLLIAIVMLFSIALFSQGTPVKTIRIANATTPFDENLSVGNQVFNSTTFELWVVTAPVASTFNLTTASAKFSLVNGAGSANLAEGTATSTTVKITSSTGADATLQSASASRAGIMPVTKWNEIVANNTKTGITTAQANAIVANTAKVSNVTHTGDVSGSTVLTIGTDKVKDTHIDWGTSAGQVSTSDMVEGSKLYYTEARVSANSSVVANTAKTGITTAQSNAIVANTAKTGITTTQANAIVANTAKVSNATHIGDVTGSTVLTIGANKIKDTHIDWGTTAGKISTFDIPEQTNLYYTDVRVSANSSVVANTAKTGITTAQSSAIVANTAKHTNVSTSLSIGTRNATTLGITSDGSANDVVLPASTSTQAGLMTEAQFDKLASISSGADVNFTFTTEKFEEDDATPTAHSLGHSAKIAGAVVSVNGSVIEPDNYTLTASTLTIGLAVLQYDLITISYNY